MLAFRLGAGTTSQVALAQVLLPEFHAFVKLGRFW